MFQELESGFLFGSLVSQQFLAYIVPMIVYAFIDTSSLHAQDSPEQQALGYLVLGGIAAGIAALLSAISPKTSREGRWVWVFPAILWLWAFFNAFSWRATSPLHFLFYVGPGEGEYGWVLFLLTLPTWACLCYSATMWLQSRRVAT